MKKIIIYSLAFLLLITAFSFTDVVRNEFKWSRVMLDEAANSTAYWNASGDATTGTLPAANGGTGLSTLGAPGEVLQVNGAGTAFEFGAGGSGITNGAAANEIPISDGTDIGPSGLFSNSTGTLTFGNNSTTGTNRSAGVAGSEANIAFTLSTKGTGSLSLNGGASASLTGTIVQLGTLTTTSINMVGPLIFNEMSSNTVNTAFEFRKGRASGAALQSGDIIGQIKFLGSDGSVLTGTTIESLVDGTVSSGVLPSTLAIKTRLATSGAETTSFRINGSGNIGLFGAGSFGSGVKVLSVVNATTNPSTNPTSSFLLYANASDGSNPYVRTPAGTIHKLTHSMMNVTIANTTTALSTHPNSEQQLQNANTSRTNVESTYFNQVRLVGRVSVGSASANDPRVYIQYTTDLTGAAGWTTIGAGTTASGEALDLTDIGNETTNWIDIPAGAKADVLYRIAQNGGDGSASPTLVNLHIQFK